MTQKRSFLALMLTSIMLVGGVLLGSNNTGASASNDSLVGYWKFEGATAADSKTDYSGDSRTGAPSGTVLPQPTTNHAPTNFSNSRSLTFGNTNNAVNVTSADSIDDMSQLSVSSWIYPTTYAGESATGRIIDKTSSTNGWSVYVDSGAVHFYANFSTSPLNKVTTATLPTSTWANVAVTWDGTANSSGVKIYIDGVEQSSFSTDTSGAGTRVSDDTYNIIIGNNSALNRSFGGDIDELRLYNRVLGSGEVDNIADGGHPQVTWTGTDSSDYEDNGNWSTLAVPDPYADVVIADTANQPVTSANIALAGLTIDSGALLNLVGFNLTNNDSGVFSNNGTIQLRNTQTISGLTNDSNSGTVLITPASDTTGLKLGNSYNNLVINDSTFAHWPLDELAGSSAEDVSGFGKHASYDGAPTPSSDRQTLNFANYSSLDFDGSDDSLSFSSQTIPANSTWCSWAKIDSGDGVILGSDTPGSYALAIYGGNQVRVYGQAGVDEASWSVSSLYGNWHHLCVTQTDMTMYHAMTLYIDGVSQGGSETLDDGAGPITRIGTDTTDYFDGKIDDIRIYSRVLNGTEIGRMVSGNQPATILYRTTLGANTDINGDLVINSGIYDVSTSNYSLNVAGNFDDNGGVFQQRSGSVIFDGSDQRIKSSLSFYNLTKQVASAATLEFGAGSTTAVSNQLTLNGAVGQVLSLRSSSSGDEWLINPTGSETISYLDIQDSNNIDSSPIDITNTNTVDSGNNTNWTVNVEPDDPTSLGGASYVNGSFVGDSTPTLSFELTDSNATDQIRYQVQIDNNSDFSSPEVDYESGLDDQGSRSFTVGQDEDDDTYNVGSSGMTMSTGNYYWRVKAIDNYTSPNESSYTVANSGSVAFQLDVTAPTNPGTPTTGSPNTERRPTWTWTSSSDAGVGLGNPTYTLQWSTDVNFVSGVSSNTTNNSNFTHGSNLGDGQWYFRVRATDSLGNNSSWSTSSVQLIDTTGPTTPVAPFTSSPTSFNQPTWSWSAPTDSGSGLAMPYTVQWSLVSNFSSGVNSSTTSTNSYAHTVALADGTWYFRVRAVDALGNLSNWSSNGSVTIDATPPTLPGAPYTDDPTNDNTPTWTWDSSSDSGTGLTASPYRVEWSTDPSFVSISGNTNSSTNSFTHGGPLADGTWYIRVNARDNMSNQSAYSTIGETTIDTVEPDAPNAPTTTTPTNDTTPTWNWNIPDDVGVGLSDEPYTVEWSTQSDFSSVTGSETVLISNNFTHSTPLAEGTWYFRVNAVDSADNTSDWSANGTVIIDVTDPTTPGDPSTSDPVNDNTPTWNWTASSDTGVGLATNAYQVQWSTDNTFNSGVQSSTSTTNSFTHSSSLADGTWYIRIRAVDQVGNDSNWSNIGSKVVDIDPPSVPGQPSTTSPTADNTPTWTWTGSTDDGVGLDENPYMIEWSQNAGFLSGVSSDAIDQTDFTHSTPLADGTWYFRVRAADDVGNISNYSSVGTVFVDASDPTDPGTPSTSSPTTDNTPTWTWNASSDGVGSGLATNAYTVEWSTDNTFNSGVQSSVATSNNFTHSSGLADDVWYFRVKAIDVVGNESNFSSAGSVETDDTAPSVPGTPSTTTPTNDTTPTWSWSVSTDNQIGLRNPAYDIQWSQDSGFSSGVSSSQVNTNNFTHSTGLADGTWYFRVRAVDSLSNASSYSASGLVLVSTSGPTVPGTPSTTTPTTDKTPTWSWAASTSPAGLASPSYYVEWSQDSGFSSGVDSDSTDDTDFTHASDLADGTWYFRVRAEDNTGMFSSYSSSGSVLVDTTAPSVPGNPSTTTPTNDTTPTWSWSASSDGGSGLAPNAYEIQWSQDNTFNSGVSSSTSTSTNFTHSSGLADGTWYFRTRAVDVVGNQSAYTSAGSVVVDSSAPSTPGNPSTTTPTNDTTPTWSWSASSDSGVGLDDPAYEVQWSQNSGFGSGVSQSTTNSTNFTHSSGLADGTWYFRVRASDNVGNQSGWSGNGQVTVDNSIPTTPGNPSTGAPSTNDTTPTWSWSASSDSGVGLDSPAYQVQWSQDSSFLSGVSSDTANSTSFTHSTGLSEGTWYFRVRAVDDVGNQSGWSANGNVFVDTDTPTSPGTPGVSQTPTSDNTPSWTWTPSTDDGFGFGDEPYEIQWSQDSGFNSGVTDATAADESYTHSTSLTDGTWYFRVRAVDDAGNQSSWSSHGTVVVDASAPTQPGNLSTTTPTKDSTPTWSWDASTDAGVGLDDPAYEIAWSSSNDFSSGVTSQTTNATNFTHSTGLDFGIWYFRVRAVDDLGNSTSWVSSSVNIDNIPPVISSINATPGSGGVIISWNTDEIASSKVTYGFSEPYTESTSESDTSPRVTSHTVIINNLPSCTTYKFKVASIDQLDNESTSAESSFTTTACSGNSAITGQSTTVIPDTGGQASLNSGSSALQLQVPSGAVGSNTDFQIKQLSPASALSGIGQPGGRYLIGSHLYDLKALSSGNVLVTNFNGTLTVSISYTASEAAGYDISTLAIFRHDGSSWQQLSGCISNSTARIVSCQTSGFSVFGLFGVKSVASPAAALPEGSGTVEPDPVPGVEAPGMGRTTGKSDGGTEQTPETKGLFTRVVDSLKRPVWWASLLLIIGAATALTVIYRRKNSAGSDQTKNKHFGIHKDE